MNKKSSPSRKKLVKLYKQYVLEKGKSPKSITKFLSYSGMDFADFKVHFDSLKDLEINLLVDYFKRTEKVVKTDPKQDGFSRKERHLTMLYILVSELEDDQLFLEIFLDDQKKAAELTTKLAFILSQKEWRIFKSDGLLTETLKKVKLDPKKNVFVAHAMSVFGFYLKDKSTDGQDTDAYIEKSTDLLFKLSDTSTLMSMFVLGKFLYQRKSSMFSWM